MDLKITAEPQSLFGSSGIRRVVAKELVQIALNVGLAAGEAYHSIIVGTDTRTSGEALKHAFLSGALGSGARVYDAGILPTPTLALMARHFDAAAMITASHNPPEYNGIKLLNPDGSAFDAAQRKQITGAVLSESYDTAPWQQIGNSAPYEGAVEQHIQRILRDFPEEQGLTVVVDSGCGAAYNTTPQLLERMGCEVIPLNCYPSGFFPRNIEPNEASLKDLMKLTREFHADLGIAHDGDADRMMAVDDKGRFISGDKLLAIFASDIGARKVVTTVDASMMIDEMDFAVARTRVGDAYVSEELRVGGDFGGEPSGAWIFPRVSLCPDGIYAAAKLVDMASRSRLSELADSLPQYPILRGSIGSNGLTLAELKERLVRIGEPVRDTADGLKVIFRDGWLLVRFSGTEPKIRLTAEAKEETIARDIYHQGAKAIEKIA